MRRTSTLGFKGKVVWLNGFKKSHSNLVIDVFQSTLLVSVFCGKSGVAVTMIDGSKTNKSQFTCLLKGAAVP